MPIVSAPTAASPSGFAVSRIRALARISGEAIRNQYWSCETPARFPQGKTRGRAYRQLARSYQGPASGTQCRSNRLARQNQRSILAAEAERIRHHGGDARVARRVSDDVERDRRIRNIIVD